MKKVKSDDLQAKMDLIEQKLKPLNEQYKNILYTEQNLLTFEGQLKSIKMSQEELKSAITFIFDGDDSDLDEALKNFDGNLL